MFMEQLIMVFICNVQPTQTSQLIQKLIGPDALTLAGLLHNIVFMLVITRLPGHPRGIQRYHIEVLRLNMERLQMLFMKLAGLGNYCWNYIDYLTDPLWYIVTILVQCTCQPIMCTISEQNTLRLT